MWDLSFPTRDRTYDPCIGSMEFSPLYCQGSPQFCILRGMVPSSPTQQASSLTKPAIEERRTREAMPPTRCNFVAHKPSAFSSATSTITLTHFWKCSRWKDFLFNLISAGSPTESGFSLKISVLRSRFWFLRNPLYLKNSPRGVLVQKCKCLCRWVTPPTLPEKGADAQNSFFSARVSPFNWLG